MQSFDTYLPKAQHPTNIFPNLLIYIKENVIEMTVYVFLLLSIGFIWLNREMTGSCLLSSEQGADKPAGCQSGDDFSLVRTQVNYVIVYKSSST